MNFNALQNTLLYRARAQGINFGGPPANTETSFNPPSACALFLNAGYTDFLARTQGSPIAALKIGFLSVAGAVSYPMNPLPANGGTVNPSAQRAYEFTYTLAGAQERYIPIVSTDRFRRITGGYVRRFGNLAAYPFVATQLFGRRNLELFPGTATTGDLLQLSVCPNPSNSPAACPASNGGALTDGADVPLLPAQYHMALVDYALWQLCDAANKTVQAQAALERYESAVAAALDFAMAYGEGDAELVVTDPWVSGAFL